jgi:hypothetical protein
MKSRRSKRRSKRSKKSKKGTVLLQMRDGTTQVIEGEGLCLDIAYRDGEPYLVVRGETSRAEEGAEHVEGPGGPGGGR